MYLSFLLIQILPLCGYFEDKVIKIPDGLKGLISQIIAEGKSAFILPMPDPKLRELIPKEDSMIGAQQLVRFKSGTIPDPVIET